MKNSKKFMLGTSAMRNYALSIFFLMVSVSPALCQEGLPAMTTSTNGTAGSTGTAPPPPPRPPIPMVLRYFRLMGSSMIGEKAIIWVDRV